MELLLTIGAIIFAIIALLAPIWLYLGQKYAWQCRQELREIKKMISPLATDIHLKKQIQTAENKVNASYTKVSTDTATEEDLNFEKIDIKPTATTDEQPTKQLPDDPTRPNVSKAQCGKCSKIMTYPKTSSGKRVKCPDCQQVFNLP